MTRDKQFFVVFMIAKDFICSFLFFFIFLFFKSALFDVFFYSPMLRPLFSSRCY